MNEQERRQELADFLHTRRDALSPLQVGLPPGNRRRAPGLRREEVAQLAGMSTTWYTWLEQGRDVHVSTQVLDSLARVLDLDMNERGHLFLLADQPLARNTYTLEEHVAPALQRSLAHLGTNPAYIRGQRWDILAWNRAACVVLGNLCQQTALERNMLYRFFCTPAVKEVYVDWEIIARKILAQFRASAGLHVGDPHFRELIEMLQQSSLDFRRWWPRHEIVGTPDGRKVIQHPLLGRLVFEHNTFVVADLPHLQLVIYNPLPEADTTVKVRDLLQNKDHHTCSSAEEYVVSQGD
jgi:transcriptional regulator with XRE-family HTH domain